MGRGKGRKEVVRMEGRMEGGWVRWQVGGREEGMEGRGSGKKRGVWRGWEERTGCLGG